MRKLMLLLVCMCLAVVQLYAQNRTVTGKVTDESGAGIAGVTVTATNKIQAVTNETGNFSISVPANVKSLVFSSLGFATQTVQIGSGSLSVRMSAAAADLDTLVITGYAPVKRSQFTGASAKIGAKEVNTIPMASFDQMLQGRVPGLVSMAGSGQPGAAANVVIRGVTSISGGSTPLYVIDGMPVEASVFQSYNPNDFESVEVLKDGVAQALYGSRGAAGVIVVTTKRGKAGKTQFTYRGQYGITEPGKQRFEMMSSAEILAYQEKLGVAGLSNSLPGWANSPLNPTYAAATPAVRAQRDRTLDSLRGINTNWADHFMDKGTFSSHDLNMTGGTEKTQFFVSAGIYDEDGIAQRSYLKRYTARANITHRDDKFTFSLTSNVGYTKRSFIEGENATALNNPFAAAYLAVPYKTLYNAAGQLDANASNIGAYAQAYTDSRVSKNEQFKANLVANLQYKVVDNVFIGGQAGVDFRQTDAVAITKPGSFAAINAAFPTTNGGSYTENITRIANYNSRAFVAYRNTFARKHAVDVSANMEYIERRSRSLGLTGYGLNPKFEAPVITPGTVANQLIPTVSVGYGLQRNILSYFGIAKYTYDNKYTLDFSVRRDGASILPPKNRWQNFYAVGGSWNVLKEKFADNWHSIFSSLRVRGSYGESANEENFPGPPFYDVWGQGSYAGQPTWGIAAAGNADADWEYTSQTNFGIDFSLLRGRLSGTVDIYDKRTKGLYIDQQLDQTSGLGSLSINAGKMSNKGIEFSLDYSILRNRDWNWTVGGNIAYNKNNIDDLGQVSEYVQGTAIIREGLPYGSHYEVKWGGVDAATGQALYYTRDGKLTNVYNNESMAVADFGTSRPPTTGGFNTTVNFKGIELGAFFSFASGFSRYNNQDFFQMNHSFAIQGYNMRTEAATMWTQPGDVTNIQSPLTQVQFSSKFIQDASFLRFRNLQVGYTFPQSLLGRQNVISGVKIYGQAQNLYTWTKWTGFDPEDNNNIAQYEYPAPRTYTVGVDLTF